MSQRLNEIRESKDADAKELDQSETITDCLRIQGYIEDLEREEKEILSKGGAQL